MKRLCLLCLLRWGSTQNAQAAPAEFCHLQGKEGGSVVQLRINYWCLEIVILSAHTHRHTSWGRMLAHGGVSKFLLFLPPCCVFITNSLISFIDPIPLWQLSLV